VAADRPSCYTIVLYFPVEYVHDTTVSAFTGMVRLFRSSSPDGPIVVLSGDPRAFTWKDSTISSKVLPLVSGTQKYMNMEQRAETPAKR
jgi:hypothetical protein